MSGGTTARRPTGPPDQRPDRERPDGERPDRERPVVPDRSSDDSDVGWGERDGSGERDDDWYERERPPHW